MEDEWLARLVSHLWPHLAAFVETSARDVLEPMVQAALPRGLRAFYFDTVDLAHCKPMQVSDVVSVRESRTGPTARDGGDHLLMLRFNVDLDIDDPRIVMKFKHLPGLRISLSRVCLKGSVAVVLRPLIPQMPFFGAAQVYFPNHPVVRLEFNGAAKMASLPIVRRVLQNVLDQAIGDLLVLPNTFVIKIKEIEGLFDQLYVWPIGVARVRLREARDLINRDASHLGVSDPYAIIQLGPDSFVTSVVNDNLNPKWTLEDSTASHDFVVSSTGQCLTVQLYDKDRGNTDDPLGSSSVVLADLIEAKSKWLPLTNGGQGEVYIQASLLHTVPVTDNAQSDSYMLTILLDRAVNIHAKGRKVVPQVRILFAGQTLRSMPVIEPKTDKPSPVTVDVLNPKWEQAFNVLLTPAQVQDQTLLIKIQLHSHMEILGSIEVPLAEVYARPLLPISPFDLTPPKRSTYPNSTPTKLYFGAKIDALATDSESTKAPQRPDALLSIHSTLDTSKEWAQDILNRLWPHVAVYAEHSIAVMLNPVLQRIGPYTFDSIRLTSLRLSKIPPVKVTSMNLVPGENQMALYLDVIIDAPLDVALALGRLHAGLKRFSLVGTLRCVLMPLCNRPPFFQSMMIAFIHSPAVHLEFSGLARIANSGNRTALSQMLLQKLECVIRSVMVLPGEVLVDVDEQFAATISKDSIFAPVADDRDPRLKLIKTFRPLIGALRVSVIEIAGLPPDKGSSKLSQIYVEVICGSYSERTAAVRDGQDPVWPPDEVFHFPLADLQRQRVLFRVWRKNYLKRSDLVGESAICDLIAACTNEPVWLNLRRDDGGKVCVRLSLFHHHPSRTPDEQGPPEIETALGPVALPRMMVTMLIHHAAGLPCRMLGVRAQPLVRVARRLAGVSVQKQFTPLFFPLSAEQQDKLHFSACDANKPTWNFALHWVILEADEEETSFCFDIMHLGLHRVASVVLPLEDLEASDWTLSRGRLELELTSRYEAGEEPVTLFVDIRVSALSREYPGI